MLTDSFRLTAGLPPIADRDSQDLYGIELEYEQAIAVPTAGLEYWSLSGDNSLRNGVEFISQPLPLSKVAAALGEAERAVKAGGCVATPRCGLHVHINARNKTLGELYNFITLYALVEPTIFATYAAGRDDSNFCVPLWMNQVLTNSLMKDMLYCREKHPRGWRSMQSSMRAGKYSAMNLSSLATFGTIEMRQAYCTTDFEAIKRWVLFLDFINQESKKFDDPAQIVDKYLKSTITRLQIDFFGQGYRVDKKVQQRAYDTATMIAGSKTKDWKEFKWTAPSLKEVL